MPWFAVAYGTGVGLYFTAEREPALWAAFVPVVLCAATAALLRRRIVPQSFVLRVIALGLFGVALGFAVATLKTSLIQHAVLRFPASGVTIAGFVELRDEIDEMPRRVRLSVKRGMAPAPGSFVEVKVSLEPPLQPLEPGSYDFARDLYFLGIGASGFVRGAVKVITAPSPQGVLARADAFVARRDRRAHSRRAAWR